MVHGEGQNMDLKGQIRHDACFLCYSKRHYKYNSNRQRHKSSASGIHFEILIHFDIFLQVKILS